jgi:hypothetical protein
MRSLPKLIVAPLILVLLAGLASRPLRAQATSPAPHAVQAAEAVAVADLWYGLELTSPVLDMTAGEQADRLAGRQQRQVWYLTQGNDLAEALPPDGDLMAYVVTYPPTGYVIVAADDRLEPIIVFAVESRFRWDQPERNFLRYFLGRDLQTRYEYVEAKAAQGEAAPVHPDWIYFRSLLGAPGPLETAPTQMPALGTTLIQWDTAAWGQETFYNEVVVAHNGNTAGVPTGCTATAMAIKMRFHSWPATGNSSHAYSDTWGAVKYSHSVNFGAQTYDWAAMPATSLTAVNAQVENLMYHAGVAVDMDYEADVSRAWPSASAMNTYFRYRGTTELASGHSDAIQLSVTGGLPVVLSSSAHTVLADGYRDTVAPYFHLNVGWEGADDGWYNLDQIPGGDATIDRSYPCSAPSNYIYVDTAWSGTENGDIQTPYNTVVEGKAHVPAGGQLWIQAGTYTGASNVPITFDTAVTLKSYGGTATIGSP